MAELRKIIPRPALSDFRQMVQPGPNAFSVLAGVAQSAYDFLEPAAIEEMKRKGMADWSGVAGSAAAQSGPVQPVDPSSPDAIAADAMSALGKGGYRESLIGTESGGNWGARNSETGAGGKKGHFGRVQFGQARLQEAMNAGAIPQGTTPEQFMASPDLQVAAENWHFGDLEAKLGDLVGREVNGQVMDMGALVAMGHLGGAGGARKYVESGGAYNPSDSFGTSLSDYARKHGGKGGADALVAAAQRSGGAPVSDPTSGEPVMVRTKDGVKPRLFSPMSGPILQAYNAAAGVAYLSEKMVQGQTDLIGMANDFTLDPQGFQQAAEAYIAQMADDAPEQFRADLTMELRSKAQQTFLGIVEDQQRDTRQRAANSSAALVDRWSSDYADALASGNTAEANAAEAKLRGVLQAREAMPGLAWTPEQSENVVISAKKAAAAAVEKAQKEAETTVKGTLNTIIDAAKAGMTAADESILRDPRVAQIAPELFREATAFTTLRDQIPTFNTMSPVQQQAALAEMKAQPVTEQWEVDLYGAAEKVAADNAKAWAEDPIERAREVLTDDPPPDIPEFDPMKPEAFLNGLKERAVYSQRLMDGNYIKKPAYLSNAEAEKFGAMLGKDVDPEIKAGIVGAIVGAMGPDAGGFFKEIQSTDPVLPHVGALMASGGANAVAVEALQGQALIDQKVVPAPSATAVAKGRAPVESALRSTPGALQAMEGVQKTAEAIYAARVPANADEDTQAKVMQEAWQAALGQQSKRGVLYGGIQKIGGQDVLLPPKVSGEALDGALKAAFGDPGGFWSWAPKVDGNPDMWMAAAGGIPSLGGEPLSPDLWQNGEIALTPMGGNMYRLTFQRGDNEPQDVRFLGRDDDAPFVFDVEALIGASLVPK